MPGTPRTFRTGIQRLTETFSEQDAQAAFPELNGSSVAVYLSHLVRDGDIERLGPKRYRLARQEPTGTLSPTAHEAAALLGKRLLHSAMESCVLFSSDDYQPFLHDEIMAPFVVLLAPEETHDTARAALEPTFSVWRATARSRPGRQIQFRHSLSIRPDVNLFPNNDLRGTERTPDQARAPTLERLFVETAILGLANERNFGLGSRAVFLKMFEAPDFDPKRTLALASGRGASDLVASILTWAAIERPTADASSVLRDRFPHLDTEDA